MQCIAVRCGTVKETYGQNTAKLQCQLLTNKEVSPNHGSNPHVECGVWLRDVGNMQALQDMKQAPGCRERASHTLHSVWSPHVSDVDYTYSPIFSRRPFFPALSTRLVFWNEKILPCNARGVIILRQREWSRELVTTGGAHKVMEGCRNTERQEAGIRHGTDRHLISNEQNGEMKNSGRYFTIIGHNAFPTWYRTQNKTDNRLSTSYFQRRCTNRVTKHGKHTHLRL